MKPDAILDAVPVPIAELAPDFTVRYVNVPFAALSNAPPSQLIGRPADELGLDPARFGDWLPHARAAVRTNRPTEYTFAAPDRRVGFRFTPPPDADGVVVCITDQPGAEPTVVDLFRRFTAQLPLAAWLRDEGGRYVFLSPAYQRAAAPDADWTGRLLGEVWPADLADQFAASDRRVLDGGTPVETLDTATAACGVRTWHNAKFPLAEADGRRYVAGVAVDLTDRLREEEGRRAVERQLLRAQKLDSLGVMAGGVAHDFNNLLTTILGNASLARMNVSDPSPVAECLRKVEGAAVRAAELCQQMLAYSGRGQFVVREVDLNAVVREVLGMFGSVVPRRAVTEFTPADPPPVVRGDHGQLRQVVLSLIANAADAVGDAAGVIAVSTAAVTADAAYLAGLDLIDPPPPGAYAVLEVADTGCGMSEETKARAFEPFFTTKFTGRGLGLSAAQGIVRGHRGAVAVASQEGRGSTFRVLLPAFTGDPAGGPDAAARPGRGRAVLVAADEDDVRMVARRLLEANGFTVLAATDPADAVATFRHFHERVAAVLLDLSSPRSAGATVLRELRRVRADVRVILTSGYGRPDPAAGLDGTGAFAVLRKPFAGDDLLSVVVRAADG